MTADMTSDNFGYEILTQLRPNELVQIVNCDGYFSIAEVFERPDWQTVALKLYGFYGRRLGPLEQSATHSYFVPL